MSKRLGESGIKPQSVGIPATTIKRLGDSGAKPAPVKGALILDEPLKTVKINGKNITAKESVATALMLANEDFKANTGKELDIRDSFRSAEKQAKTYGDLEGGKKGRVAAPGSSFHQSGQAVDINNWKEAETYLKKYNLVNDLADDKGHFSVGEFSDAPPITNRDNPEDQVQRILTGQEKGVLDYAKGKLGEQKKGPDNFVQGLKNPADKPASPLNPFSDKAFMEGFLTLPKAIPALAVSIFKRGYAVGDAAVDQLVAGQYALKILKGGSLTPEEQANLASANNETMKALGDLIELIPTPFTQFAGGVGSETAESLQEGKSPKEAVTRGVVQGTEQALLTYILNKVINKVTGADKKKIIEEAKKNGITDKDIDTIANKKMTISEAKKMVTDAQKSNKTYDQSVSRPTDDVGKSLAEFQKNLGDKIDDVGAEIGKITDDLKARGGKVNIANLANDFSDDLGRLNIKIGKGGKLDFSNSDIANLASDQKLIDSIWQKIKPYNSNGTFRSPKMNVRDAIAQARNIGNQVYAGTANKELTASSAIAAKYQGSLRSTINSYADDVGSPLLKKLNESYHELLGVSDTLRKVIRFEGVRAPEFIRRAFSNVGSEPRQVLGIVDDIAKRYDIPSGIGLFDKGRMAVAAENTAGIAPPNSMEGIMSRVANRSTLSVNSKLDIITRLIDKFTPTIASKEIPPAVESFNKLVDSGITPADLTKNALTIGNNPIINAFKGAASSTILDKLTSIGLKKPEIKIGDQSMSEPSMMDFLVPKANASPKIPQMPQKPSIPSVPSQPIDLKSMGEAVAPNLTKQLSGLAEMAKKFGQLTPEQLESAAKPKQSSFGLINKMTENKMNLENQLKAIESESKPKKTIAQIYNESDTKKALDKGVNIFKKSFNIK